jgi:hypothetical protein
VRLEGLGKLKKPTSSGIRTGDLPVCSIVPQPTTLPRAPRRWVDNIKMDLREIGWDGVNWIDMDQDRDQWSVLVNTVLNFRIR